MNTRDARCCGDDHDPVPDTLAAFVADVLVALAVVRGRAQLLRRRIHAGEITEARDCMEPLGVIEETAGTLDDRLHRIAAEGRKPRL